MLNNQDFTRDRHLYIGGSDIGAILGLSPYRTPLEVWMDKTGRSTNEANNLAIRFGNFAEDFVANEYALQTQSSLLHYPKPIPHPKYPHLVGHVDRFVMPSALLDQSNQYELFDEKGVCCAAHLLECKTANPFNQSQWGESGTNQVPLPYLVQCLWYLAITNLERADLAVLFSNQDFRIYSIARDLELEQMMIDKALFFWNNYVLSDIAPPAKCEADYQHLYPIEAKGKSTQADSDLFEMILRLNEVQEEIKTKESEVGHIKEAVMAKMQDCETLSYEGITLATWKQPKASIRFDSKRFSQEYPQLYSQYQNPVNTSRRLVIKNPHAKNLHDTQELSTNPQSITEAI